MRITSATALSSPPSFFSPVLKKSLVSSSFFAPSIPFIVSSSHIFTAFSSFKDLYEKRDLSHENIAFTCCKTTLATAGAFFVWQNAPIKTALATVSLVIFDIKEASLEKEKILPLLTSACFIVMLLVSFPEALVSALVGLCLIEFSYALADLQKEKRLSGAYHLSLALLRLFQSLYIKQLS